MRCRPDPARADRSARPRGRSPAPARLALPLPPTGSAPASRFGVRGPSERERSPSPCAWPHRGTGRCQPQAAPSTRLPEELRRAESYGAPLSVILYGGEELLVLAPGAGLEDAMAEAERIRAARDGRIGGSSPTSAGSSPPARSAGAGPSSSFQPIVHARRSRDLFAERGLPPPTPRVMPHRPAALLSDRAPEAVDLASGQAQQMGGSRAGDAPRAGSRRSSRPWPDPPWPRG